MGATGCKPSVFNRSRDRMTGELELLGAWGDTSRVEEALAPLAEWLGVERAW